MSEWKSINGEKNLPQYSKHVLLWNEEHKMMNIGYRTHSDITGEHWSVEYEHYITHWRELPDPPQQNEAKGEKS